MADLSDVTTAFGVFIGAVLYPVAPTTAEQASSVAGMPVRVEVGWPAPQALDAALAAGKAHVSIFPPPGHERNVTRYMDDWEEFAIQAPTFTLTAEGAGFRVGGTAPSPYFAQNLVAAVGGVPYAVQSVSNSSATSLATALAALIPGATRSGALVTPAGFVNSLVVGGQGTGERVLRQQERQISVIVWAPTPAARTAVIKPIDAALADTRFLTLADGSKARIIYQGTHETDFLQKQAIYRRDLMFLVEYATTAIDTFAQVVSTEADISPVPALDDDPAHTFTIFG